MGRLAVIVALAGCGRIAFELSSVSDGGDASADASGDPDVAMTPCTWQPPAPLDSINLPTADEWGAWMSPDRLELIFTSDRGTSFDIYRSTRGSASAQFGTPQVLLATPAYEDNAYVSPDGQTIWYSSDTSGDFELYYAPRATPAAATLALSRPATIDEGPALTVDQLTLFWESGLQISRAERLSENDPWMVLGEVPELLSIAYECCVSIADDGTFVFVSDGYGEPTREIIMTHFDGTSFGPFERFELAGGDIADVFISRDARTILYSQHVGGGSADIFYTDCQ